MRTDASPDIDQNRRPGLGVAFESQILATIRVVLDAHAKECERTPKVILLNPSNHSLLGWDEAFGLPVLPDERAEPMRARLVCGTGRAGYCDQGDVIWVEDGDATVEDS